MRRVVCLALILVLLASSLTFAAQLPETVLTNAAAVLKDMTQQPDSEQLKSILKDAHGIAIFPSVIKAGLGIGGRYGEGVVLRRDTSTGTWYGPYFVEMKGLSYGLQAGIQSTALVLVVATEEGIRSLEDGRITLGGNVSLAAGPVGRSAEASMDVQLKAAMYSYSMSKGVFAGASFEGATISNNASTNKLYWEETLTPEEMLDKKAKGTAIQELLDELTSIIENSEDR
ncbi:lipid-binding SYLF domain-containing protein [Candidatus Darwinibacter acetoxidans]